MKEPIIFQRKAFGRRVITEALESEHSFYFDALQLPQKDSQPIHSFQIAGEAHDRPAEV